tara:strand:- start:5221 stop:6627 length:1407 start_codon:yes stop_codon:yes gene_type:complete
MGMKNIFLFKILILISFFCNSQDNIDKVKFDSLINYQVQKKETLYSISKKFDIEIDDIIKYNPELKNNKLRKREIIIVPLVKKLSSISFSKEIVKETEIDSVSKINEIKIKKNFIRIAYMAPFKIESIIIDSTEQVNAYLKEQNLTTISINFYNGILFAADELDKKNISVEIDVYDTDNKIDQIKNLKNSNDFNKYDLIVGPLINRNYNAFFNTNFKTNSVSPLVYDDITLNSKTIIPVANDSLKRERMFKIIDELILKNEDQCAMIISDSLNKKSKNKLLKRFPLAEIIDLNEINNSVDPKITDSLLGSYKENWVFLETKKSNLISSVTSLLNSQINNERKIRLFSTVSNENYENSNISYEKLGNLSFMYPSNSKPNSSDEFTEFQNKFLLKFGKYPDRISIKSYDVIKDLLLRIAISKSLKNSLYVGETKLMQNKFNYEYNDKFGFQNTSFFILRHEDLNIIDHQN